MNPLRIFISSVQKELELERAAVASLITTDPFLLQHGVPVLFENEPPAARPAPQGYLATLRGCALYVLIVANEYGHPDGDLSATHHEYREAQRLKLPTIVFLKGAKDDARSAEVKALIAEAKKDGYKYVRFHDREDLKPLMLEALRRALAEEFNLAATPEEVTESRQLIDAASMFESAVLREIAIEQLDPDLMAAFNQRVGTDRLDEYVGAGYQTLYARGLAVRGETPDLFLPTAAVFVLFGQRPADRFPQCQMLIDAYDDIRITGKPKGQLDVNAPIPRALEQVLKFIDDHTFHPRRVVGLNNLRLDEYPVAALREALVNAVAHRSYRAAQEALKSAKERNDEAAKKEAQEDMNALILFKSDMGAFLRLYTFLSQIFDYGNTAIEKRAIFYRRLLPLLEFGRERVGIDLSKVMLTHHNLKNLGRRAMPLGEGEVPKLSPITEAGSGLVQEKQAAYLTELIEKLNELFGGETTDQDQLVYVNHVIRGKLLESETLRQQAANNTKEQFATSPDLDSELTNAIVDALDAHTSMSTQALNSDAVRRGLKEILLTHAKLWELLRGRPAA